MNPKIKIRDLALFSLLFFFVFISWKGEAKPLILLQAQGSSSLEFKAFLRTDVLYQSFEEFYINRRALLGGRSKDLLKAFKEAQRAYLSGDFHQAKRDFRALIDLSLKEDWSLEEKETLHYSFLRLIQISKNALEKRNLWTKAFYFDHKISPDSSIFPPVFIKKFQSLRKEKDFYLWVPGKNFRFFSAFQINGRIYQAPFVRGIKLPKNHPFRITLLSNSFFPVSKILTSHKDLEFWVPSRIPFVTGSCENFKLASSHLFKSSFLNQKKLHVFFDRNCIKAFNLQDFSLQTTLRKTKGFQRGSVKPFASVRQIHYKKKEENNNKEDSFLLKSLGKTVSFETEGDFKRKNPEPTFLKRKWVWIGLGSFVTASVFMFFKKQESSSVYKKSERRRGF